MLTPFHIVHTISASEKRFHNGKEFQMTASLNGMTVVAIHLNAKKAPSRIMSKFNHQLNSPLWE